MTDITLRQLEYFVAVAEEQSITKAALKCHVTQAGVSLAIKDLEKALGVQLAIRRKSRGMYLTRAGRAVATRANALLRDAVRLVASVHEEAGGFSGAFTVGCVMTLSTDILAEVAEYFATTHPNVTLDFVEDTAPELQERMLRGQIDISFINEAQRHPEVEFKVLRKRDYLVALSPEHPLASSEIVSLQDLAPYPAALLNVRPANYLNESLLSSAGTEPNIVYRSASLPAIRALVGRGLAYALMMERVPESHEGLPITYRPIAGITETNSIVVAYPKDVRLPGLALDLIVHCERVLPFDETGGSPAILPGQLG